MSKRSNKGKAYFYAMGQRDKVNGVVLTGTRLRLNRQKLSFWAHASWFAGYHGF